MKKRIAVLGASGSIGTTTLNIIRQYPEDFEVTVIANNDNLDKLNDLASEFKPKTAICAKRDYFYNLGKTYKYDKEYLAIEETYADCDIVVNGIAGIAGLAPSVAVMKAGKTLATANKESFVTAGTIINKIKNEYNAVIIPLDSEHSTVWQCIGDNTDNVKSIILTASGGAFRDWDYERLKKARAEEALKHPNWVMGKKITIDCATLMNKGMEIIEAKHLFGISDIEVVQHKQSIIHSMVQYKDNSIIAGLSYPDMTLPVQLALYYPIRKKSNVASIDFASLKELNFGIIDEEKFPCIAIAKKVFKMGDIAGTVMNSANEVAVKAYLDNRIGFYDIPAYINDALDRFATEGNFVDINKVFCMDTNVSEYTFKRIYGGNK